MRPLFFAALLIAIVSAGCAVDGESYHVQGTFKESATQDQIQDFVASIHEAAPGVQVRIMESFPPRFVVDGIATQVDCENIRGLADRDPAVDSVGTCSRLELVENPDAPTSSGPGGGP